MPLKRPWHDLEESVLREVPDRYGVYELGTADGTVIEVDHGPLRDAIKDAIAYHPEAESVRFVVTPNRPAAVSKVESHRERLDGG